MSPDYFTLQDFFMLIARILHHSIPHYKGKPTQKRLKRSSLIGTLQNRLNHVAKRYIIIPFDLGSFRRHV